MPIQCPTCLTENPDDNLTCFVCGSPLVVQQASYHLPPGTILKNQNCQYQIEKTLGAGGFGITYKGTDLTHSRTVAIKENWPENGSRQGTTVVWPSSVTPQDRNEQIKRILNEAQYLQQSHQKFNQKFHRFYSNIVQVFNYFTANNTAYIIMEFIEGKSLYDLLQSEGRLPEERVKKYFLQICDALKVIHSQNLLHRDIKPENILIDQNDKAILIDFGNAREFIANKTHRMTQIVTQGYAPIEQYGQFGRRGPSLDIYALCASMYELLTGQLPPPAPDRLNSPDPLVPPRQIVPTLDPSMEQVILKGMNMKVEERFATADDLIDGLEGKPPGFRQARELVQQQKLSEAAQKYQQCFDYLDRSEIVSNLAANLAVEWAIVLLHLNDTQAETVAQKAILINPQDGRSHGVLGLVKCRQAKWSDALDRLKKAANLSPDESWIQANLAWALGKSGNWLQAEIAAKCAVKLEPNSSFALGLQAWIAINQQQWKPAIRHARQAITQGKKSPQNQELQSWIYPCLTIALDRAIITKQAPDVERCLQQFTQQLPDNSFPWGFKGWKQGMQGLWREALANFEQGSRQAKVLRWVLLNYGITQEHLQNISGAVGAYQAYEHKFTANVFVLFRIGTLLGRLRRWEEAINYLEKAVQLQTEYAEAHHNLAWVLLNIKDSEGDVENPRQLISTYRQAIKLYQQQGKQNWVKLIEQVFEEAGIEL
ncbi:MAG: protein kinase [Xenococcaceae cyanobacterium]